MKILKVLLLISALFQFVTAGDFSNPTKIVNGGIMHFETDANKNWYEFTMSRDGNILISGTDKDGDFIDSMRFRDKDFNCYRRVAALPGWPYQFKKGKYSIHIDDKDGGSFTIFSPDMTNSKDLNPKIGSILNPRKPKNGVAIDFGTNTLTNNYLFEMKEDSDFLVTSENDLYDMNIYDMDLDLYESGYVNYLSKGKYYIHMQDNNGGSFTIHSEQLIPPTSNPNASDPLPRLLADVNGDDKADTVGFGSYGVSVALSNGSGFASASLWLEDFGYDKGWKNDKSLRKMADVDGDGYADVVGFGSKGVSVALSNGSGFDKASLWLNDFGYNQGWRNDKSLRILADVNGDGMMDIAAFGNNGISVALSTGSDFGQARLWVNDFGYNQGWRNDKGLRIMADVNGDGKADIVGFGNNGVSVALSNGNSFVNARRWVDDFGYNQGWRNNKGLRFMSDVNGDGKADIVGFGNNGVSVALSNGNSFVNARRWVNDFGYNQGWKNEKGLRMMSDVDGDGKADIVGFGNNGVSVAYSNGNSFTRTSRKIDNFGYNQGWKNDKHLRLMADVDGDGADDVVGFGNGGVSVSTSTGQDFDYSSSWLNDFGYNQGWKVDFSPYQEQQ